VPDSQNLAPTNLYHISRDSEASWGILHKRWILLEHGTFLYWLRLLMRASRVRGTTLVSRNTKSGGHLFPPQDLTRRRIFCGRGYSIQPVRIASKAAALSFRKPLYFVGTLTVSPCHVTVCYFQPPYSTFLSGASCPSQTSLSL
jgi:hypothetical protein